MENRRTGVFGWIARVLGLLYVAMLWWAWWNESQARQDPMQGQDQASGTWIDQWAVVTHLLPAVILLIALVLGWWWPLVAAIGFLGYAVASIFSWMPEWVYAGVVTAPPLIIGLLFLLEWLRARRRTSAPVATG